MADNHESTMKWKVDITQLKAAMTDAKRSISLANAEFKTATAGMDKWQNSTTGLEAKIKQLNSTLPQQKTILAQLEQQYALTAKNMGENSAEAQRLKIQIENQKAAIAKTEASIERYGNQLSDMRAEEEKSNTALGKLSKTIEEQEDALNDLKKAYANAVVQYGENSDEAQDLAKQISELSSELKENKTTMQNAEKAADDLDQSLDEVDDSAAAASDGFTVMKGALANLVADGIRKVISGLEDLAKQTYETGSQFESSMANVAAISGASAEDIERLTEKAKEMGEKTVFSASESADAFQYMAMAGWKTEDMLNGIEGIMNLAAASGEDLATTSDIVTDALTAMGYSAGDAGKLADVMAAASSNANTNVALMGATFQYAAPIVGALGYKMEDTAVAIGLMANAGIKGEKAGTALRSILTRLSAPPTECANAMDELGISLTDSEGKMKSMDEVMQDLRSAFAGLDETSQTAYAKQIAGQEAMSGLLAIVNAAPADFDKLKKAVEGSTGAAQQMADTMNDTVEGQVKLLRSKVEGIMIKVWEKASGSIRKAIDTISSGLDKINWSKVAEGVGKFAEKVADGFNFIIDHGATILSTLKTIAVAFVTYKAVSIITSVITAFQGLVTAIKAGESAMTALNTVMNLNPYALVAAALAALVMASWELVKATEKAIEETYGLNEEQQELVDTINEETQALKDRNAARDEANKAIEAETAYSQSLWKELQTIVDENGKIKEGYEDRAAVITGLLSEALGIEIELVDGQIQKYDELKQSIDEVIRTKRAEALLEANKEDYTAAIQNQSKAYGDYAKAVEEAEAKNQELTKAKEDLAAMEEAAKYMTGENTTQIDNQRIVVDTLQKAYDELSQGVSDAQWEYLNYANTIENYEGLMAAVASGDVAKLESAMDNLSNSFLTADNATKEMLENQLKNFQDQYAAMQSAVDSGMAGVTQEQVDSMAEMVNKAEAELDKLPPEASAAGTETGKSFASSVAAQEGASSAAGEKIGKAAKGGAETGGSKSNIIGMALAKAYIEGVGSKETDANTAGKNIGEKAKSGADSVDASPSGSNFAWGYANGIGDEEANNSIWNKAWNLGQTALAALRRSQQEGSPSKLTKQSGVFFGEGFVNGIVSMVSAVGAAGAKLGKKAVESLSDNLANQMKELGQSSGESLIDGMNSVVPDLAGHLSNIKGGIAAANSMMTGSVYGGSFGVSGAANNQQIVNFNQTINSPKAVDRLTLYRETNSLLFSAKVRLQNV